MISKIDVFQITNHSRLLSSFVVCLVVLYVITGAPKAHGADEKSYPGSMCVQWSGGGIKALSWSSVANHSPDDWIYLDCPIIQDNVSTDYIPGINSGWVKATDRHYSLDIRCGLYYVRRNASDSTIVWTGGSRRTTVGAGERVQHLEYSGAGRAVSGHAYYSCAIPPTYDRHPSEIHTYNAKED